MLQSRIRNDSTRANHSIDSRQLPRTLSVLKIQEDFHAPQRRISSQIVDQPQSDGAEKQRCFLDRLDPVPHCAASGPRNWVDRCETTASGSEAMASRFTTLTS